MSSAPSAAVIRRRRLLEATITAYRQPTLVNDMLTPASQHIVDPSRRKRGDRRGEEEQEGQEGQEEQEREEVAVPPRQRSGNGPLPSARHSPGAQRTQLGGALAVRPPTTTGVRSFPPRRCRLRVRLFRRSADVLPRGRGWRSVKPADFHDHEDFCVLFHIKVFAIMKFSLLSSNWWPLEGAHSK